MGFKENFKNFFTPADDEMEEDIQQETNEVETEETSRRFFRQADERSTRTQTPKVVNMNSAPQLQVVLVKPETFEDGIAIADHLCAKRTVVVNLENAPKEVVRRLVDFLSGVAYANKGTIKRAANNAFVVTPNNVDVMGDVLFEENSNNSFYRP